MFEISSNNQDEITIKTDSKTITFNILEGSIDSGLEVGKIYGPGEYEIGEASIRAISTSDNTKTIYDVGINNVHVGIIDGIEEKLDDIGVADILCTSSVKSVRELSPKIVISMGNVDGMVTDLKLTARTEKKLKVKNVDSLPTAQEVIVLN